MAHYRLALANGASAGTLIPGVPEMLRTLAGAGVFVQAATGNASVVAREKLVRLGTADHFEFDAALGFGDRHPARPRMR